MTSVITTLVTESHTPLVPALIIFCKMHFGSSWYNQKMSFSWNKRDRITSFHGIHVRAVLKNVTALTRLISTQYYETVAEFTRGGDADEGHMPLPKRTVRQKKNWIRGGKNRKMTKRKKKEKKKQQQKNKRIPIQLQWVAEGTLPQSPRYHKWPHILSPMQLIDSSETPAIGQYETIETCMYILWCMLGAIRSIKGHKAKMIPLMVNIIFMCI